MGRFKPLRDLGPDVLLELLERFAVLDHSTPVGGYEIFQAGEVDFAVDSPDQFRRYFLVFVQAEEHGFADRLAANLEDDARRSWWPFTFCDCELETDVAGVRQIRAHLRSYTAYIVNR